MALVKKLVMSFKLDSGSKVSMSVLEPRADITEAEIKTAMGVVVAKPIFEIRGAYIAEPVNAAIVETDTTEFDFME